MIEFKRLSKYNNWEVQPSFYIHGTLIKDTDLVTINPEGLNRVSMYYKEGQGLPHYFYDIAEGKHFCLLDGQLCALFTWKVINIAKKGIVQWSPGFEPHPFDIELKQLGLIVDFNDAKGISEATTKFNNRDYLV